MCLYARVRVSVCAYELDLTTLHRWSSHDIVCEEKEDFLDFLDSRLSFNHIHIFF